MATLPVRSDTSYPYLISSVKASTPAPVAPVAVAVRTEILALLGLRLEEPEGPLEYRWEDGRWNLVCLRSCVRQLAQVQGVLLARRFNEAKETSFMLAAEDSSTLGVSKLACTVRCYLGMDGGQATKNRPRHSLVSVTDRFSHV